MSKNRTYLFRIGVAGTLCLYDCIRKVFLWVCLCLRQLWRRSTCTLCMDLQEIKKETCKAASGVECKTLLSEICGACSDCDPVLPGCLRKGAGHQSMGCVFYDSCRELQVGRLCGRSCLTAPFDRRDGSAGEILLQVLLSYGGSIFPASHTAVFLSSQEQRTVYQKLQCLHKKVSVRY